MGRERRSKGNGRIVVGSKLRVLPRTRGARYFAISDAISPNGVLEWDVEIVVL